MCLLICAMNFRPLGDTVVDRIKGFAAMNKLKKEALMVIASNLPKEEIEGLHQVGPVMCF